LETDDWQRPKFCGLLTRVTMMTARLNHPLKSSEILVQEREMIMSNFIAHCLHVSLENLELFSTSPMVKINVDNHQICITFQRRPFENASFKALPNRYIQQWLPLSYP
jgi:hypothetical protein